MRKQRDFLERIKAGIRALSAGLARVCMVQWTKQAKGVAFMQIAVVTGASSGLGREFVRELCRKEIGRAHV